MSDFLGGSEFNVNSADKLHSTPTWGDMEQGQSESEWKSRRASQIYDYISSNMDDPDDAEATIGLVDHYSRLYGVSPDVVMGDLDGFIESSAGKTVTKKSAFKQIKDGWTRGLQTDQLGRYGNMLMNVSTPEQREWLEGRIKEIQGNMPSTEGDSDNFFVSSLASAANLGGTMIRPLLTNVAITSMIPAVKLPAVMASMSRAVPSIVAKAAARVPSVATTWYETAKVEAGNIYIDMVDNGVDPIIAEKNAKAHGFIAGGLESASLEVIFSQFPFMKKAAQNAFMKMAMRERVAQGTVKALGKILKDNLISIPVSMLSETSTEVLQEVSSIYFERNAALTGADEIKDEKLRQLTEEKYKEWYANYMDELEGRKEYYGSEQYAQDVADRLWEVAKETAKGMLTLGLIGGGAQTVSDVRANAKSTNIYKKADAQLDNLKDDLDKARETLAEKKEAFQNDPLNDEVKAEYDKAKQDVAEKETAYNLTPDAAEYGEIISKKELTDEDIERLAELDARSQLRREREAEENPDWKKAPEDIQRTEPQTLDVGEKRLREIIKAYTPNLTDPETDEIVNLLNVRARALDQDLDTYLNNTFQAEMARYTTDDVATVVRDGKEKQVRFKGNVDFAKDGKAIITLTPKADFSTWVHELGHIFRRQIAGDMLAEAERFYGVKDGIWTVDAEERFTEDLTNYLMTRKAPNSALEKMFRIIADALHNVYDRFTKRGEVSDDIARVFDQMFADPGSAFSTQTDYNYDADSTLFQENPTPEEIAEAEAQYKEIEAKYKGTDQWLKAPNGKPTKLTERQWVQVRTPNFINWFGDWINDPANASKVVDPETGEPRVVYHGTTSDNLFEVFDAQKGQVINATWHSSNIRVASHWSRTEQIHRFDKTLNEKLKPITELASLEKFAREELGIEVEYGNNESGKYWIAVNGGGHGNINTEADAINEIKEDLSYYIEKATSDKPDSNRDYGIYSTFTYADFINLRNPLIVDAEGSGFDDISFEGEKVATENLAEIARERGNDGVVVYNVRETSYVNKKTDDFITFSPNQIKSATDNVGTFSRENNSILFQGDFQERVIAAQDLRDEAKEYGHNIKINGDGSITLYHGTSKENADNIYKTGIDRQSYFAYTKAEAEYYGKEKNKDGVVLKVNVDPRYIEFAAAGAELYTPEKLTLQGNMFTIDPHTNLLFQSAYHGSGASFDKFDTDFIGSGEGSQSFGWGIYLSQDKGIARDYAQRRYESGEIPRYLVNGNELDENVSHIINRNLPTIWARRADITSSEIKELADEEITAIKKRIAHTTKMVDFVESALNEAKATKEQSVNKFVEAQEGKSYYEQLKYFALDAHDFARRYQREATLDDLKYILTDRKKLIEKKLTFMQDELASLENIDFNSLEVKYNIRRNLYTATIPDDTGNNYLYWDKNYSGEEKVAIREKIEAQLDKEGISWQPKYKNIRWNSEMNYKRGTYGRFIYELVKDIFKNQEMINGKFGAGMRDYAQQASEFLSRAGFVGIDYPAGTNFGGGNGARNFVIFNADDITIDKHTMWQENEEVYREATENGEYIPDDILQNYKGNEWADLEIQAREDYRKQAIEEDDYTKFLEFNRTFDTANRTDDYYNEVYNSAFTGEIQSRAEANREFLDNMTHDEMEKILNIIAKTDAFRTKQVGSPHKVVDKTLYGMMNGDKKLSENNYKRIKAMMNDDPDAWREFIALAFEDQETYELIQKQKALFPKSEAEKLREANRQLRQDIARKDKSLNDVNARIADLQDTIHFWRTRLNTYQEQAEAKLAEAEEDKEWLKAKAQIEKYKAWQKAKEQMDAEKIKAGMKLEETKDKLQAKLADQKAYYKEKLAELRRAYNERAYYQRLIRIIFKKPPKMCDITIANEIEAIQAMYSPTTMTDKTRTRLELALMDATNDKQKAKIMNMLSRKSLRGMTLAEVADLADKITELRAEGVEKRQQQLLDIKEKRLDIQAGLLSDIGETDKLDRTGSVEGKKSKGKLIDRMKSYWWDINRLSEDMGEHWEAFFKDEVGKAYQDELRQIDRRRTALLDKMKELKLNADTLSKTEKIGDKTYTHDILLHWYICMQNADSMAALVYGNFEGDPNNKALMDSIESTIKEGIDKLSKEEIDLAEWMINSFSGDDRVRLWDVFRTVENRSPEMVLRYFPMIRQVNKVQDVQKEPLVDLGDRTTAGRAAVKKNFSLERIHDINWQNQTPLRLGAMSIYMQAIQNQEHYIAFAQLSKDMKYIYGGISDQVISKYGQNFYDNLNSWIDRVINPNAYKARYAQQNIFMKALSNSMAGALAGNVVTMIKQAPSMLFFLPYCDAGHMAQSLYNFARDHKAMTEFAKEKSPYLANRNIDDVLTNLNEQLADPNSKFRKARQLTNALLKPIAWIDEFACVVGWNSVYTTEMSKGATEEEAIAKANDALLKTQPQATAIYSPQAYNSGSDLMRTILVFTRQANQIFQMVTADMGHLAAEKQFKQIISMSFVLGLNALLMGWIGRKFAGYGDDDESAAVDIAKDIAANLANNIPVVGPTIVPMIQRSAYTSSGYVNPISEMLNKTHRAVYKSIKAGEVDFDTAMRLITDAMGTAGLPKVLTWRAYKALKDEDIWTLFIGAPLGGKDGSK